MKHDKKQKWIDFALVALSALVPIVGILLYFAYKKHDPKFANILGVAGIIGFLANFIPTLLSLN